jgi:CheY-like chemotaxis protein
MTQQDDQGGEGRTGGGGQERQFERGAFYAKTILDRHGVAMPERSRLVAKVLDLAYSAAHRRVRGTTPWTVEDLEALAQHFGESLDELFVAAAKTRAEPATFVAGDLRLKCQVWLGAEIVRPEAASLVAVKDGLRWAIFPAASRAAGPMFQVRQLLMEPDAVVGSRIAVLDDQPNVTESLCVFLRQAGFRADAFHAIGTLRAALAESSYDAYVLDWVVGEETVGSLVEELRQADAHSPIAILTGKATERGEVVTDIAELVAKHDVRYFSKPLDPHMITAVLSRLIAATTRG